jgi:hypothetical protein
MARRSSLLVLVVLIQLLGSTRLDAQRTLSGAVRDTGGGVLPGVSVTATSPALPAPRTTVTDAEGRYAFGDLPDGAYTMTFTLPGFVETTHDDIHLPAAAEKPLEVVLRVGLLENTVTLLRGSRPGVLLNPRQPLLDSCTMRVMPADPSIDPKLLKEPDATRDYAIKSLPPPCRPSHPMQAR